MSAVNLIRICKQCADTLLGFVVVRESFRDDEAKCELCKKKKPCDYYRVTSERNNTNAR